MTDRPDSKLPDDGVLPATSSVAKRLLHIIFASYFAFTSLVTVVQLVAEYRNAEHRVTAEIRAMQHTFGPGIANAMWRFQDDVLREILIGMKALPTVVGVKVMDSSGAVVRAVGMVVNADGLPVQVHANGESSPADISNNFFAQLLSQEFDLVYLDENARARPLGKWVVYSNQRVVVAQVEYGFLLIFVSAIIKAFALWFIFLYVVRRWLGQPLSKLTEFVRQLDIDNLGDKRFVLHDRDRHELHFLADAVNHTARKLHSSVQQNVLLYDALDQEKKALKELNETLEQRVAERTAQLNDANQQLAQLSLTDALTGIANRRCFDQMLAHEWSRAERLGRPLTLLLVDVDWFKSYNDHHGHVAGDVCLRRVAQVLSEGARRAGDLVARYGGEEFVIIVPSMDANDGRVMAQTLCDAVRGQAMVHASSPFGCVTISIGVASLVPGKADSADTLLALADQGMYRAKAAGRNRVELAQAAS